MVVSNNAFEKPVTDLDAVESLIRVLPSVDFQCPTCENAPDIEHVHFIADQRIVVDPNGLLPRLEIIKCTSCGKQPAFLFSCSNCHSSLYCGKRCQSAHWSQHSTYCTSLLNGHSTGSSNTKDGNDEIPTKIASSSIRNFHPRQVTLNSKPKSDSTGDTVDRSHPSTDRSFITPRLKISLDSHPTASSCLKIKKAFDSQMQSNIAPIPVIPPSDMEIGREVTVIVSSFESPEKFCIQEESKVLDIQSLTEKLNKACKNTSSWSQSSCLKVGDCCAAVYEEDGEWYRARIIQVLNVGSAKYEVLFIDFGNVATVSISDIRPLPSSVVDIPPYAFSCAIDEIKPMKGKEWPEDIEIEFEALMAKHSFTECKILAKDGHLHKVDLYDKEGKRSIRRELLTNGLAMSLVDESASASSFAEEVAPSKMALRQSPQNPQPLNSTLNKNTKIFEHAESCQTISKKIEETSAPSPQPLLQKKKSSIFSKVLNSRSSESETRLENVPSIIDCLETRSQITGLMHMALDPTKFEYFAFFPGKSFEKIVDTVKALSDDQTKKNLPVKKGDHVVGISITDGDYYRGEVLQVISDTKIKLFLFDVGYAEEVEEWYPATHELMQLPAISALVKPIKLQDVPEDLQQIVKQIVSDKADSIDIRGKVISVSDGKATIEVSFCKSYPQSIVLQFLSHRVYYSELFGETDITQQVATQNDKVISKDSKEKTICRDKEATRQQEMSTIHNESPLTDEDVQDLLDFDILEGKKAMVVNREPEQPIIYLIRNAEAFLEINEIIPEKPEKLTSFKVGSLALAYDHENDEYCRVLITERMPNNEVKVYVLDYGGYIKYQAKSLYKLPDAAGLKHYPALGIKCCVENADQLDFDNLTANWISLTEQIKFEVISQFKKGFYIIKIDA